MTSRLRQRADRLLSSTLRIGVTGLSGAGKSTFLASLINQLENHTRGALAVHPRFAGLQSVRWRREAEGGFDYPGALAALTAVPPRWPASTRDLGVARIDLRYRRGHVLGDLLPQGRLTLEILDYPGEWLLDLPLLRLDYAQWCAQVEALAGEPPRRALAGGLFDELAAIDPAAPCDEARLRALHARYVDWLRACRALPYRYSRLTPGRFLLPEGGTLDASLEFIPLSCGGGAAVPGSWFAVCEARYRDYKTRCVEPFYTGHFARLDRQVVLVDMLGALESGREALVDMSAALADVLEHFRYGSGWLERLVSRRVDRVALCATKVDHVFPEHQGALQRGMEDLLFDTLARLRHAGVDVRCLPLASVRAARRADAGGQPVLEGRRIENGAFMRYRPPALPERLPGDLDVRIENLPHLAPPDGLHRGDPFPHYRMDSVLDILLGDYL